MTRTSLLLSLGLALTACTDGSSDKDDGVGGVEDDSGEPTLADNDQDGFTEDEDCNDNDGTIYPGATEVCDNIDNNCDGQVDEDVTTTYYRDADGDGFGDEDNYQEACSAPTGYVPNGNDCADDDSEAYPGNTETCDYIDNDCDGQVDEDVTTTYYADSDVDGYGDPENGVDACSQPAGYVEDDQDCDDTSDQAFPGNLEICDEIDNNCDGQVDEDVTTTYYADLDGDNWGDASVTEEACSKPTGYAKTAGDCDDSAAAVNPDADEECDLIDNDCDGTTDEDDAIDVSTWYRDSDGDSYGDATVTDIDCYQPTGYVADDTDCDDSEATTYPGADEYCDGHDDDCDEAIDEDDAVDVSTWYEDSDSDGYGDASSTDIDCYQPTGYVSDDQDCDDNDADQYPGADEYCNSEDDDCDGDIDEDGEVLDGDTFYYDADSDGTGDSTTTIVACSEPSGYVDNDYDCNDTDATEPVVADASGGSSTGTGTWSDPYASIQDAMDDADECAIVMAGTYKEAISFDKSITVTAVEGADYTTIDADGVPCDASDPTGCEPAVSSMTGGLSPELVGFTITGGTGYTTSSSSSTTCADSSASYGGSNTCTVTTYEYYGGGVYVDGDDLTLTDCVIEDNTLPEFEQLAVGDFEQNWVYSYGGGIAVANGSVSLEGTQIFDNWADQGGGIYLFDAATADLVHSDVKENTATDGAGANVADGSSLSVINSVFACNEADTDGGGIFASDSGTSVSLVNVVLYGDESASGSTHGAGFYGDSSASLSMMNSIVSVDIGAYAVYGSGGGSISYNDVYNADTASYTFGGGYSAGTGGISQSAAFKSPSCDGNPNNDDFSLKSTSPAINAGNPASAYNDTDGTTNDMGAYGGPNGDW